MRRACALIPLLLAGPAMAACPDRLDLMQGIVLVQNGEHFRRADVEDTARGLMEVRLERPGTGEARSSITFYEHGLAASSEQTGSRIFRTAYRGDVGALDRLDELGEVSLSGEVTDSAGERRALALIAAYLGAGEYAMAECRYATWQVRYAVASPGGEPAVFHMDFAPELGVVLAARQVDEAGREEPLFAYTWIGTRADVQR